MRSLLFFIASAFAQTECPTNAEDAACADFTLTDMQLQMNIDMLCNMMPGMTTCSLKDSCKDCSLFSSYANLCQDMPNMMGCQDYTKMCGTNPMMSENKQCKDMNNMALKDIPATTPTTRAIFSMCNSHAMDGCNDCQIADENAVTAECDVLATFTKLCTGMPNMAECESFTQMCTSNPSLEYCQEGSPLRTYTPMLMFFHTGINDYILFQDWVPRTDGQYALAWILIFLSAIGYEALTTYQAMCELNWRKSQTEKLKGNATAVDLSVCAPDDFGAREAGARTAGSSDSDHTQISNTTVPFWKIIGGFNQGFEGVKVAFVRSLFRFFTSALALILMLIVMSFNVGLFFAVTVGYLIGHFLFAPITFYYLAASSMFAEIVESKQDCH